MSEENKATPERRRIASSTFPCFPRWRWCAVGEGGGGLASVYGEKDDFISKSDDGVWKQSSRVDI